VPSLEVVKRRNDERPNKKIFVPSPPILDRALRETMSGIGLWLNNSNQSPEETVGAILRRAWKEGALGCLGKRCRASKSLGAPV
jgi:hypothetical protein